MIATDNMTGSYKDAIVRLQESNQCRAMADMSSVTLDAPENLEGQAGHDVR